MDYHLIRAYVEHPEKWAPGVVWTPLDIAALEGHPTSRSIRRWLLP